MLEGFQPGVEFLKWFGLQLVDPPIGQRMHFDEPGITKDTEMLGNLRLVEPKSLGDFPHGQRSITQEFDHV